MATTLLDKMIWPLIAIHKQIVECVAKKREGISSEELIKQTNSMSGGRFDKRLNELEASGFIEKYVPYGKKVRDQLIRLTDEYTIFYLHWIQAVKHKTGVLKNPNYWSTIAGKPSWNAWAGYTFEAICDR